MARRLLTCPICGHNCPPGYRYCEPCAGKIHKKLKDSWREAERVKSFYEDAVPRPDEAKEDELETKRGPRDPLEAFDIIRHPVDVQLPLHIKVNHE